MRKIANANELEHELRRILAYAQSELPSRRLVASALSTLSLRLAANGSLDEVVKKLKSKFGKYDFQVDDDEDLGTSLTIERKGGRDPGDSYVVVSVNDEGEVTVDVHSSGPSMRSTEELLHLKAMDVSKVVAAASKAIEKYL